MKISLNLISLAIGFTWMQFGVAPASSAASPVVFESGFEEAIDPEVWKTMGNPPQRQTKIVRSGGYAIRSFLDRNNSEINFRTELKAKAAPRPIWFEDTWYGFSIYLPESYTPDELEEVLAQWHREEEEGDAPNGLNPCLALRVKNGNWLVSRNGNSKRLTFKPHDESETHDLGAHEVGQWTDWVFRVRWDYRTTKTGQLQVWKNGKEVLNLPSIQIGYNDVLSPYFQMGIYKALWKTQVRSVTTRELYHDEFKMASSGASYEDVAPGERNAPNPPGLLIIN